VKRRQLEFLVGWLDALRRDDREAMGAMLAPEAVWQGLREEWRCGNASEVVEMFAERRDDYGEIETVELIGAERHAILHVHGGDVRMVEDVPLPDGIYNVFAIEDGRITRIDDFSERARAFAAAGLVWPPTASRPPRR
jgi:ketosteroid isomerase-like protein